METQTRIDGSHCASWKASIYTFTCQALIWFIILVLTVEHASENCHWILQDACQGYLKRLVSKFIFWSKTDLKKAWLGEARNNKVIKHQSFIMNTLDRLTDATSSDHDYTDCCCVGKLDFMTVAPQLFRFSLFLSSTENLQIIWLIASSCLFPDMWDQITQIEVTLSLFNIYRQHSLHCSHSFFNSFVLHVFI